jgi:hypothetical protein
MSIRRQRDKNKMNFFSFIHVLTGAQLFDGVGGAPILFKRLLFCALLGSIEKNDKIVLFHH